MRIPKLREKSRAQLQELLKDQREKLRKLRFDLASGKLKKVSKIGRTRREIARILTFLNLKRKSFDI